MVYHREELKKRMRAVRRSVFSDTVDGAVLTGLSNIRYLTGFSGSFAFLFLARRKTLLVTDGRYEVQVKEEVPDTQVRIESRRISEVIVDLCRRYGIKSLGFEPAHLSVELYNLIKRPGLRMSPLKSGVEVFREIKSSEEIAAIRKAIAIAEGAFLHIKPMIRPGIRECDIAAALSSEIRSRGSVKIPFDPIVASGKRSALPHAQPTTRKLRKGDMVVIDWGAEYKGYFSDMTRTLLLDRSTGEKRRLCDIVLEAQKAAVDRAGPGVSMQAIDRAARDVIQNEGYGLFFGHGTGHGVGLDVHEAPRVSALGKGVAKEGMVFTVEPGIYVPGLGGVRIEDMAVITEAGVKLLTRLPRAVEVIS